MTDKQKKMLKRVITYSELLKYDVIGLAVTLLMWVLFMMVDDLVLENPGVFMSGIVIMSIVVVIDCILMIVHGIYVRVVTVKKDWLDMVEKAEEVLSKMEEDDEAEYGSIAVRAGTAMIGLLSPSGAVNAHRLGNMATLVKDSKKRKEQGSAMAALFGVKLRSTLAAKLALVLMPVLLLGVAFGVRCLDAAEVKESAYTAAGTAVSSLVDSFQEGCGYVISQDPYEGYIESGYSSSCYLDDSLSSYVMVKIDNQGLITDVDYIFDVDIDDTKEENMIMAEEGLSQMYSMVISSGVEAEYDTLLEEPILTDTFKESFLEGSYYENIYEETDAFTLSYFTYVREDSDDSRRSYFRVAMKS